uniref:cilia- and flagella-associated protein 47-like n=1 Tax=Halichoerus grypus TaxID=9711 RepID=UPI001659D673
DLMEVNNSTVILTIQTYNNSEGDLRSLQQETISTCRPGITLPPKGNIDIPVLFMPHIMKLHRTMVIVQMMRANRESWPIDNFDELSTKMKRTMGIKSGEIQAIHWIYPILGLPQALHPKFPQVVIKCQSRKRIEQEVEVTLTGDFFGENPILDATDFVVIPKKSSYDSYKDID